MKSNRWFAALALAVGLSGAAAVLAADAPVPVTLGSKSTLWLDGTSTMHDYEATATELKVSLTRDAARQAPANVEGLEALIRASGISRVDVEVPVKMLKSKKDGLNKNMWKALKATEHPTICWQLNKYSVAPSKGGTDTLDVRAEGTLEVAGSKRPVTLSARAWRSGSGLWIAGSQPLKMSDFGIKPPTMMMGTLRVGDGVTVHYRLLLMPKEGDAGAVPEAQKGAVR